jgi:hypothetical protein
LFQDAKRCMHITQQNNLWDETLCQNSYGNFVSVFPINTRAHTIQIRTRLQWLTTTMDYNQHHTVLHPWGPNGNWSYIYMSQAAADNQPQHWSVCGRQYKLHQHPTANQLIYKLHLQNEEWERILSASRGKLELPKCLAYIVVYDWNNSKPQQWPKLAILTKLKVQDTESQQQTTIEIKDPAESHKTLGTYQNPTGNPDQQARILQHRRSVSNNISKQTTWAVIGAMHVNRSLLRILAFKGTKLHGLRLCHRTQGISHIKQVIQHTRQQEKNGKMYKIILDYGQLLAGVHCPILQHPKPKLPHIKDPLITTIRQFLPDSQLNIVILSIYIPQPLCGNDQNIMSKILKIKKSPIVSPDHFGYQK